MKNFGRKKLTKMLADLNAPRASGTAYSVATVLPVLFSFAFLIFVAITGLAQGDYAKSDWFLYASFLIPQIAFACIGFFFINSGQANVKETFKTPRLKYFILAIILQIGLLSLSELNTWFLRLLGGIGYEEQEILIPSMDGFGFIGVLLVIAVFPAILEEFVFRGLILKGLKDCKEIVAVLVCGALFALYHQKPEQTIYQFCCGVAFALVTLRSGSILPTVVAHFLNNAWILIMTKFSLSLDPVYIPFLLFSALCLIGSLVYLFFFDKPKAIVNEKNSNEKTAIKDFLIFGALGIVVCALSWILALVSGL